MADSFKINRAPVLTLWAAVVAGRMGFDHDEALTLGRAVAGLNAQAKGQRLGIFTPTPERVRDLRRAEQADTFHVGLLGRAVPATMTAEGIRALAKGKPDKPASVERYLASKFGDHLAATERAMAELAAGFEASDLAVRAFRLYENFRPSVPKGAGGWGAAGALDLDRIRSAGRLDGLGEGVPP